MCTSIFTVTKDGKYLLSRTMDFSFELDTQPVYLPREHSFESVVDGTEYVGKYGVLGAGTEIEGLYTVADGVNEKGLSMAELYLPGEAYYAEDSKEGAINLAPHEFITWAIERFATIDELEKELHQVHLVAKSAPLINIITPLHWIVTDRTGRCVVIEPLTENQTITENPVGVMTNTPNIQWHFSNLHNYLHVRPKQYPPVKFGEYEARAFSQGTGTMGLPGGYTPPERFVRAAFFKEHIKQAENETEGVSNAYHILSTVRIPKGIVVTADDREDFSQYVGTMCNTSLTYYYTSYENYQIAKVQMTDELLQSTEPRMFKVQKEEAFKELN